MKFRVLALLTVFFVVFFLVNGCIKTAEISETPESPAEEGAPAGGTETQEPPQREGKEVSEELTQLLAKAGQKVTSMSYFYYGPPDDQIGYNFYVKGDKMKLVLPERVKFDTDLYYDT